MRKEEAQTEQGRQERGVVVEVLPRLMFRVRLDEGALVTASISPSLRRVIVRLIAGSEVLVTRTHRDPHRASIVQLAASKKP